MCCIVLVEAVHRVDLLVDPGVHQVPVDSQVRITFDSCKTLTYKVNFWHAGTCLK